MQIALIVDKPSVHLADESMYLAELKWRLKTRDIDSQIFVVTDSGLLQKIDLSTGIMRLLNSHKIAEEIKTFDIAHIQFSYPLGFSFGVLKKISSVNPRIVVHTHGYDVFSVPSVKYGVRRNMVGRWLIKFSWQNADRLIAVCNKSKQLIVEDGIPNSKVDLLYNGVDENLFLRRPAGDLPKDLKQIREESDFILLTIGVGRPVKNHEILIQAFNSVRKDTVPNRRISLIIVGTTNKSSRLYSHDRNLKICFLGRYNHKDLPMLYNLSDAFILPSLSEAHPWSLLEAMSCEMVVMASNVGGIPETIEDPRFLCNPYDRNSLREKLELLFNLDEHDIKTIGKQNRDKILSKFTLENHVNNLRQVYSRAMQ